MIVINGYFNPKRTINRNGGYFMSNDQIIRPRNLPAITGLSRTSIWRLEKAGQFPKRVRLSAGAVGWRLSEVMAWLQDRQAVVGG